MLFERCTNYLNKDNFGGVKVFFGFFIKKKKKKGRVENLLQPYIEIIQNYPRSKISLLSFKQR